MHGSGMGEVGWVGGGGGGRKGGRKGGGRGEGGRKGGRGLYVVFLHELSPFLSNV
jgi:hypothetical protein